MSQIRYTYVFPPNFVFDEDREKIVKAIMEWDAR